MKLGTHLGPGKWASISFLVLEWQQKRGPDSGSQKRALFSYFETTSRCPHQVLAGWSMWDVLRDKVQKSGKIILRVNVDETALTLGFAGHSGTLKQQNKHEPCLLHDMAPTRGTFSNIAFICDTPEVQVLLPQIIVGNEHLLPKRVLDEFRTSVGWLEPTNAVPPKT